MDFLEIHDQFYEGVKKSIRASIKDESVAEDLFQNAFIRFRENLGRLKDPSKLPSWIFRIAHNRCQDHFRSRKKIMMDWSTFRKFGCKEEWNRGKCPSASRNS
jgi:RNA polymerase sigma factor (sigma-70 family)